MKKIICSVMVGLLLAVSFVCTNTLEVQAETSVNNMDFNSDYLIDVADLASLSVNYNVTSSSSNWNSKYDLVVDNVIDVYDIVKISKAIGTSTLTDNTDITSKFIDKNFKNEVYKLIGKTSPAPILYSDVKSVKELIVNEKQIKSLSGIEYFIALTKLECSNVYDSTEKLVSLDVSKNTALISLSCNYNKLTTLDVSNNIKLEELNCSNLYDPEVKLPTLDVSKNIALTNLDCSSNRLTNLNVSKNIALTNLDCHKNQLANIDVSQNILLSYIKIYNNQLKTLDVSKNTALKYLECSNNYLTVLDVSKNTILEWLYFNDNQLATLDVTQNARLASLCCTGNNLTTLDISKNTSLVYLNCYWNQLTTLFSHKNTWPDGYYKTQFVDANHSITTTNLVITLKN